MTQIFEEIRKSYPQITRADIQPIKKGTSDTDRCLAYISLNKPLVNLSAKDQEKTQLWSRIFDIKYKQSKINLPEQNFDTGVWQSSYSGRMIDDEQMKEWVDSTIEKLKPYCHSKTRVLEIGCGTGLVMFPLLDHIGEFVGTDGSDEVIQKLKSNPSLPEGKTKFYKADAAQVSSLEIGQFDLVILHSVAQYFPSADYLVQAVNKLEPLLSPNSLILLGDIRSFPLRFHFYGDVLLSKTSPETSVSQFKSELIQMEGREKETLFHPVFFHRLQHVIPWISSVKTQIRSGLFLNEMSKFRYDVLLDCKKTKKNLDQTPLRLIWSEVQNIEQLRVRLNENSSQSLILSQVPNERIENLKFIDSILATDEVDLKNISDVALINEKPSVIEKQNQLRAITSTLKEFFPLISLECGLENDPTLLTLVCTKSQDIVIEKTPASPPSCHEFSNYLGFVDHQSELFKALQNQLLTEPETKQSLQAIVHLDAKTFDLVNLS